ncbi:MAG TPA: tetratricopeptide repeat protein [Candidatus Eisenbacteria bacterium]|nr:tetratricopeptide repeat protein [Candidatus Eisenbacteria bacterium]
MPKNYSLVCFCALVCLVSSCLFGQTSRYDPYNFPGNSTSSVTGYKTTGGTQLFVNVFAESTKTRLDRQSLVKLTNQTNQSVSWQTTADKSQAGFGDIPFGHYDVEVSAIGYLTAHKEFHVITATVPIIIDIILQKDPAAVNLDVLGETLSPKARKETKRAISDLKSGKWVDATKHLDTAYRLSPSNPDLTFLLGYAYYQRKQYDEAKTLLGAAGTAQALTLLGRISIQQEDYGRAISNLEKAIVADSNSWVAHDLLATSYLKEREYEKARDEARIALTQSDGKAPASQLVLGQALVNLGQRQEGIKALQEFVTTSPTNPNIPQVKTLIAQLEMPAPLNGGSEQPAPVSSPLPGIDPMLAAAEPTFSVKPWQPPSIDENKPSVASGVACPVDNVVQMTSARVQEFVSDISRIAAIEHLLHEQLDEIGDPLTKETRTFNYVASVTEPTPGFVEVDEYRQDNLGLADFPDHIASSGFATLALVFHPSLRDNFEMTCEGLGEWHGQPTWMVHFRQRDDRPARIHDYKVGGSVYSLKLKGRAWITPDRFQIVRIESELVSPVPQIRLAGEHQVVEYGPVPFANKHIELWLPKSAEIYLDFRRHRYYRKHSFDHYMLFSVDAQEHRKEPPTPSPNLQ